MHFLIFSPYRSRENSNNFLTVRDFRLPPQSKLRSAFCGILRSVER